jgi:phosphoglycerate dehydrogenase-like enzyme
MENVILTQHTGGGYIRESEGKIEKFLLNLNRLLNKESLQDQVDLSRGY